MAKAKDYLDFIKIEHTLFALPFAYTGAFLAADGWFGYRIFFLILTAFTGLRVFAMSINRIIDREIDALNPRTSSRHLPKGIISVKEAYIIAFLGLIVYFLSAYLINRTAFMLSPIPAITAWVYPYLKRYTCLSHFVLGLNLAYAPGGGWVAVTDSINIFGSEFIPFMLGIGIMFWVAGFDIIYALQDVEFDRKYGLHSIGAHFGSGVAKIVSAISHILFFSISAYTLLFHVERKVIPYGLAGIAMLLIFEHYIIREKYDEKKIQLAFFYSNAVISSLFLGTIILNVLLK
ncbi:4-hydroxybenzoate polyprenyltransferase [Archaeoglobus sulfaticallidus PM70-1]|uniref:4-hydroxybenzoate polyprenyltransferase n=1 Tax=Archaeoglobus sulfaticallidus PM70-1 TaxID=387631 RepID=N0BKP7_9EURY|nr:UbiA-like polyprenyltransferase [Archaeoglobus sulfaticallidus]AGK60785.1 4-hydroxybenzoate polyprenyltransferase [Archaeoglobus sulfaticallidus PM70-1]